MTAVPDDLRSDHSSPDGLPQIVLLHGYAMQASDLSAFTISLGLQARFHCPQGSLALPAGGFAWWPIDEEAKARALAAGPRDLVQSYPAGRGEARLALAKILRGLQAQPGCGSLYLIGFSQGGMLACETLLHEDVKVHALALLSSSRLAFDEWRPRLGAMAGLPVLVAHGRQDDDLAFDAGVALHAALQEAGALTQWLPFDGGHQIPLIVWRVLRKFLIAQGVSPLPTPRARGAA